MNRYSADFETTTNINDCRVWAWGLVNIDTLEYEYGNSIQSFIERIFKENCTLYFHNLKFDGEFILYHLLTNGFDWVNRKAPSKNKELTTLIADSGVWYQIKLQDNNKKITVINSLNIIPFSVDKVAKTFGLEISKLKIDYNKLRPIGYQLTDQEIKYLQNDCLIIAKALRILFSQNLTKITQGANALYDFKQSIKEEKWEYLFPEPKYDEDIRSSYKGGWTYVNPKYQGKIIGKGLVFDVNSLYPYVMYSKNLPYGEGVGFRGNYEEDPIYKLYIQRIRCKFQLKNNYLPTIQIKGSLQFIPTQYLESSKNESGIYEDVVLTLTNVDLMLFFEHYDVFDIEYIGGYKFKQLKGIFCNYIDKWMDIKIKAQNEGNKGMRQLSKLMLNALYGKFGLNPKADTKRPHIDENNNLKYTRIHNKNRKVIYLPIATFITAYAREKTIRTAQQVYDRFLMSDTDSIHIKGWELPNIDIDDTKLGFWKLENRFVKAIYLRQKCYIETICKNRKELKNLKQENENLYKSIYIDRNLGDIEFEQIVHCAGMPEKCHQQVTYDNFKVGTTYKGKLQPKHVKGGIVLVDTEFTIKG